MKKAIRILAFLMTVILCLTGCTQEVREAITEEWVEQFETVQKPQLIALWEQTKNKISAQLPKTGNSAQEETTESTPPTADTAVQEETKESSSWWEAFQDSKATATVKPDEVEIRYHAKGATNVPKAHVISFKNRFSSKKLSDQCPVKPGYVFLGWGTTEGTTEVAYQPGDKYDKRESVLLYAVWEECTHENADGALYGLNLESEGETRSVRCTRCDGELSPSLYYFSDYLKATQPFWKRNYKNLNGEALGDALADYLAWKKPGYEKIISGLEIEVDEEKYNIIPQEVEEFITGSTDTGMQFNELYVLLFQDEKIRKAVLPTEEFELYKNIDFFYGITKKMVSAADTLNYMIMFGQSCNAYDEEVLKGITNTYHIQMQKIDSGIQFATAASQAVGFLRSLAGAKSIAKLIPDPEDFREDIENLNYARISYEINLSVLSDLNASPIATTCEDVFRCDGDVDLQVQKERWRNGPTAEQTLQCISQLDEDDAALPSWYFYFGWRVEYECAQACAEMIQMILNDKM